MMQKDKIKKGKRASGEKGNMAKRKGKMAKEGGEGKGEKG